MNTDTAGKAIGISRFALIRKIHAGQVPAVRVGRKLIVDPRLLELSQLPPAPPRQT